MSRLTPLNAEHEQLGAMFTDFAGWRMPLRYSSELAEHHAVRTTAGLFDLTHMGEIVLTGPQETTSVPQSLGVSCSVKGRVLMKCRRVQSQDRSCDLGRRDHTLIVGT